MEAFWLFWNAYAWAMWDACTEPGKQGIYIVIKNMSKKTVKSTR